MGVQRDTLSVDNGGAVVQIREGGAEGVGGRDLRGPWAACAPGPLPRGQRQHGQTRRDDEPWRRARWQRDEQPEPEDDTRDEHGPDDTLAPVASHSSGLTRRASLP